MNCLQEVGVGSDATNNSQLLTWEMLQNIKNTLIFPQTCLRPLDC